MKIIFLTLFLLSSSHSVAATIFEPSLSLTNGSFSGNITGSNILAEGTPVEATYNTFSGGIRYGITREYVHLTAVIDGYLTSLSTNQSRVNTDLSFKANVGIGMGYEWNIPLRTYIILGMPHSGFEMSYFFSEKMILGFRFTRLTMDYAGSELTVNTYGVAMSFPIEFEYPSNWWRKKDW